MQPGHFRFLRIALKVFFFFCEKRDENVTAKATEKRKSDQKIVDKNEEENEERRRLQRQRKNRT